jgi:hypothetical protein
VKSIIVIALILMAGLATAYTPDPEATLNETMLNETMPIAIELNETINETMNKTTNETMLNETELNETTPKEYAIIPVSTKFKTPFKGYSELSKFGKQKVYNL